MLSLPRLYLFATVVIGASNALDSSNGFAAPPTTFAINGFANWGAGDFPTPNVGQVNIPQSSDQLTRSMVSQFSPSNIQSSIQTLVNFFTRHTASTTTSPTIGIGAARNFLLKQMQEFARPSNGAMEVSMPCFIQPTSSGIPGPTEVCNVQTVIKGAIDPNRAYVYTGHYDSRNLNDSDFTNAAPGADDNASAVAIALEMVRILAPIVAKTPPAATIMIVTVAGEEQGLFGSAFLAATLKNTSVDVQGNWNNDIVGSGSNAPFDPLNQHTVRIFSGGFELTPQFTAQQISDFQQVGYADDTPSRHLGRFIQETNAGAADATDMQVALTYKLDRNGRGGDHESFLSNGFPAVRFTEPNEDFFHQHQDPRVVNGTVIGDNIDFVDFDFTGRVGRVNLLTIWNAANAPGTPKLFQFSNSVGFLASSVDTPLADMENVVELEWDPNAKSTDPLLDHFEIVYRPLASQQWTHSLALTQAQMSAGSIRLELSKDSVVFGLRSVGNDGKKSPATFAVATT